jgi:hypothetical protein
MGKRTLHPPGILERTRFADGCAAAAKQSGAQQKRQHHFSNKLAHIHVTVQRFMAEGFLLRWKP